MVVAAAVDFESLSSDDVAAAVVAAVAGRGCYYRQLGPVVGFVVVVELESVSFLVVVAVEFAAAELELFVCEPSQVTIILID